MGAGMQQAHAKVTGAQVAQVGTSVAVGLAGAVSALAIQYAYSLPEGEEASWTGFGQYLATTGHIAEALAIGAAFGGVTYVGYGKIAEKLAKKEVQKEKIEVVSQDCSPDGCQHYADHTP